MSFVPPCCAVASTRTNMQPLKSPHLFVFGLGYVGLPFALKMRTRGFAVSGITKSRESSSLAASRSIHSLATDAHDFQSIQRFVRQKLSSATHLLSTVPPDAHGDPVLRAFANNICKSATLVWLGYTSSTSVYGNHNGGWVHETSPCLSPSPKGIYGTGRSALHTLYRNPWALSETNSTRDMIVSRVHLTDIIDALSVATNRSVDNNGQPPIEIVNISDDQPASRDEVFRYAAEMLNLENASRVPCSNRSSSRHRDRSSKRVSNAKMKRLLLPKLKYPTFREGFDSLVSELRIDSM